MSLEDKLAIQEVIAQYSYTYDARDAEGFAALFTEDAQWQLFAAGATHPAIHLKSRTAIHAWALQRLHERRGHFISRHHQCNTLFETLTTQSARTRTMVLVTHQDVTEAAPRLTASGVYHDQIAFCREHLAHIKCPRSIDFTAELPRLPTGKLYKRELRDRYWAGHTSRLV